VPDYPAGYPVSGKKKPDYPARHGGFSGTYMVRKPRSGPTLLDRTNIAVFDELKV